MWQQWLQEKYGRVLNCSCRNGRGSMASVSRVRAFTCAAMCISSGTCTLNSGERLRAAGALAPGLFRSPFSMNAGLLPGWAMDGCDFSPKSLPPGFFELGFSKVAWFSCHLCLISCCLLIIFTWFLVSFSVLLLFKQVKGEPLLLMCLQNWHQCHST